MPKQDKISGKGDFFENDCIITITREEVNEDTDVIFNVPKIYHNPLKVEKGLGKTIKLKDKRVITIFKRDPYKIKIKKQIFKNNPMWNRLFNIFLKDVSSTMHLTINWINVVKYIENNMEIINKVINPIDYISKSKSIPFQYKDYSDLEKTIKNKVTNYKYERFLSLKMKNKINHLVNDEIKQILLFLFENDINEKILKKELFSRLEEIKTSEQLLLRIKSVFSKSKNWSKDYFLSLIKKNGIKLLNDSGSKLLIEVKNYEELSLFAPNTWCIKTSKDSFDDYVTKRNGIQLIELNFDKMYSEDDSVIGITMNQKGELIYAFNYKNKNIKSEILAGLYF